MQADSCVSGIQEFECLGYKIMVAILSVDISCLWNQVILSFDTEERRVVAVVPFRIGFIQID